MMLLHPLAMASLFWETIVPQQQLLLLSFITRQSEAYVPSPIHALAFPPIRHHAIDSLRALNIDEDGNDNDDLFALWDNDDDLDEDEVFVPASAVDSKVQHARHLKFETNGPLKSNISKLPLAKKQDGEDDLWGSGDEDRPFGTSNAFDDITVEDEEDVYALWSDDDDIGDDDDDLLDDVMEKSPSLLPNPSNNTENNMNKLFTPKGRIPSTFSSGFQNHRLRLRAEELEQIKIARRLARFKVQESKMTADAVEMALDSLGLCSPPSKRSSPGAYESFQRLCGVHFRLLQALHVMEHDSKMQAKQLIVARAAQVASGQHDSSSDHLRTIQSIRNNELGKRSRLAELVLATEEPNALDELTGEEMKRILVIRGNVKGITNVTRSRTIISKLKESYRCQLY